MRGRTVRTPERVAEAQRLRAEGLTWREIGERLGVSLQAAQEWVADPDGAQREARKRRYDKTCVDCGGRVSGTDPGRAAPEPRCAACFLTWQHETRHWTSERVIAAIQRFHAEHGRLPNAASWAHEGTRPEYAPWLACVTREFGSWNAAVAAAGFSPRSVGHYGRPGEDPEVCREIAARYDAGEGTLALAREYGCSVNAIVARARRGGATIRPPGRNASAYRAKAAA